MYLCYYRATSLGAVRARVWGVGHERLPRARSGELVGDFNVGVGRSTAVNRQCEIR